MTPKGHRVIRGHCDLLYGPKGHGDRWGRFDLVYDIKRSRGRRDLLYVPKGDGDLCDRFDLVYDPKRSRGHKRLPWPALWPQKVTGSLEVAVTYFMTPEVTVTFAVSLT